MINKIYRVYSVHSLLLQKMDSMRFSFSKYRSKYIIAIYVASTSFLHLNCSSLHYPLKTSRRLRVNVFSSN